MPEGQPPLRRADDQRFEQLERKVDSVAVRVDEIRDWLIGEPESSALGRQLLSRSRQNRIDIERLREDVDQLEDWRTEWRGSWRLVVSVGTVLGIVGTFFGIVAFFRPPA